MSSTDSREKQLRRFYAEELAVLAELLRAQGASFYAPAPDPKMASYYTERTEGGDYVTTIRSATLADDLRQMWTADGLPEFAALSDKLAALAEDLRDSGTEPDDVSPFIYAMF